jgi:hypothetical protein
LIPRGEWNKLSKEERRYISKTIDLMLKPKFKIDFIILWELSTIASLIIVPRSEIGPLLSLGVGSVLSIFIWDGFNFTNKLIKKIF